MGNKICSENQNSKSPSFGLQTDPMGGEHESEMDFTRNMQRQDEAACRRDERASQASIFISLKHIEFTKGFRAHVGKEHMNYQQKRSEQEQFQFETNNIKPVDFNSPEEDNLSTIFNDCFITIQDELGRLVHGSSIVPNWQQVQTTEPPSRKLTTDNFEIQNSLDQSFSVQTLTQRLTGSFMQSSTKLLKNQVPKSVQIDDVFEFDSRHLEDVKAVTLLFWRSKEAFEATHERSASLYDGFEVDPKRSMASQTSETRDAAQYLFGPRSPDTTLFDLKKESSEEAQNQHKLEGPPLFGQCEIKLKSITRKSYNSDWFKIKVAPEIASESQQLKKNDVIAKILISSQIQAPSKNVPPKPGAYHQEIADSSSYGGEDCLEEEFLRDGQDGLNTLFCNTFSSGKSLKLYSARRCSSRAALANVTCDESIANTHNNLEELMNQNQIQNQRRNDQQSQKTPEAPLACVLSCLPCHSDRSPVYQRTQSCNAPREGALRQRCQECGAQLQADDRCATLSDNRARHCAECESEAQNNNESIAIKVRARGKNDRGSNGQRSNPFFSKTSGKGQNRKLKSFYHEEIEQWQRQLDSQRYGRSRLGNQYKQTRNDVRPIQKSSSSRREPVAPSENLDEEARKRLLVNIKGALDTFAL